MADPCASIASQARVSFGAVQRKASPAAVSIPVVVGYIRTNYLDFVGELVAIDIVSVAHVRTNRGSGAETTAAISVLREKSYLLETVGPVFLVGATGALLDFRRRGVRARASITVLPSSGNSLTFATAAFAVSVSVPPD